jgi:hypothetical protein
MTIAEFTRFKNTLLRSARLSLLPAGIAMLAMTQPGYAVPSFARQTGLPCNMCHTTFPELTPFGRLFKLNGYTMSGLPQITAKGGKTTAGLSLNQMLPLSAMFEISHNGTAKSIAGTQNGDTEFPQQLSLFLAGSLTQHLGSFFQVTYTGQSNSFSIDNTDIRYARMATFLGKSAIWGLTLNNNPTVEDLWNSTPAWGFPYASSDVAPGPTAGPVITSLAADVAGVGLYGMWSDHVYGDVSLYRTDHIGGTQPPTGTGFQYNIQGIAPYWRFAYFSDKGHTRYEVGTYGMSMSSVPNAESGPRDRFVDTAGDAQIERDLPNDNMLVLHATGIHEYSALNNSFISGAAGTADHDLNLERGDLSYHLGNKFSATGAAFRISGTPDALLYPAGSISGNFNGRPSTTGYIGQLSYWMEQNVELLAQYTVYTRFNGASHNYDGTGRNASDNNTLYLAIWLTF